MKIKRIQIKNIGPYINENIFQFDVSDLTKRLALIGGKNGAGKTTLFNAIKICLYGCIAYGFESNNVKYYTEIEKIINTNEKLKKIGDAEVIIDLLFDDGKDDYTYTFARSWKVVGTKISESFTVYKNRIPLSSILTGTWVWPNKTMLAPISRAFCLIMERPIPTWYK